jgi:D-inositol-3-phosphate glycosyltransferase
MLGKNPSVRDNANMRIAMISYHSCPLATLGGKDTGGMNVYVRDLTRELGRRGVGVDVFTRSQDEHVPHVLHELGYGNRIVHIPSGPETEVEKHDLANYVSDFVTGIREFQQTKGLNYSLIHSHYWLSGLAGLSLKEEWNLPMVHMFHTLAVMKNRVAQRPSETTSTLRLETEQQLLREADRVVAATRAELAQIQWLYQAQTSNVVVIPPGVDGSRFYPIDKVEAKEYIGVSPDLKIILFVGRIEALKGIDTLIEAVALMRKNGVLESHPFCLAVIGGDPGPSAELMSAEMDRLKELCESLGLGDLVLFLGKRDQDTLHYYYNAAEVVVVPSHYESFGLVALESGVSCTRS